MKRGLVIALAVQVALLAIVAGPRLWVRQTGDEFRLAAAPADPIDPLRGAYVDLRLRGLPEDTSLRGTVFIGLRRGARGLYRGSPAQADAPADGPYLRCHADGGGEIACGIESYFASQSDARRLGDEPRLTARIRVGLGGRAVLVGLD